MSEERLRQLYSAAVAGRSARSGTRLLRPSRPSRGARGRRPTGLRRSTM